MMTACSHRSSLRSRHPVMLRVFLLGGTAPSGRNLRHDRLVRFDHPVDALRVLLGYQVIIPVSTP